MRVYPPLNHTLLSQAAGKADAGLWVKFPNLNSWISGDKKPTVKQLADFAKEVHIPFGFFFLDKLPEKEVTIPLFRTNSRQAHFKYSPELEQTINDIQRRQNWLVEYLRSEGREQLPFVGRFDENIHFKNIADDIRETLQLPINWSQFLPDKEAALRYLIQRIESIGIFVAMNGVIGNSPKNLNPEEFKGFVLSNKWAPYIFINGKDYPAAKLFTLMHELAHIWVDKTAVFDIEKLLPANTTIEKLCDAVAAELLIDENLLLREWKKVQNSANAIQILERFFKVSQVVIARRLFDMGILKKLQFFQFYNQYSTFWDNRKEDASGGDFYLNQNYRVGHRFFSIINEAATSGKLLFTDAYKLTNLYGTTFHKFKQLESL